MAQKKVKKSTASDDGRKTIEERQNKNSKKDAVFFALNTALSIAAMDPISLARNIERGARFVQSRVNSDKFNKEREEAPVDKKTGLKLKTQELTPEEDLKRVNPDIGDFNSNSKNNCMLCSMTYEMRRRGYDVTANKSGDGYYTDEVSRWFPGAKADSYPPSKYGVNAFWANLGSRKYAKGVISDIEKSQPEGARGTILVTWGGGGGHSMYYEISNGKLLIRDGQINKTYTQDKHSIFIVESTPVDILSACNNVEVVRLDNLDFNPKLIKECCS